MGWVQISSEANARILTSEGLLLVTVKTRGETKRGGKSENPDLDFETSATKYDSPFKKKKGTKAQRNKKKNRHTDTTKRELERHT